MPTPTENTAPIRPTYAQVFANPTPPMRPRNRINRRIDSFRPRPAVPELGDCYYRRLTCWLGLIAMLSWVLQILSLNFDQNDNPGGTSSTIVWAILSITGFALHSQYEIRRARYLRTRHYYPIEGIGLYAWLVINLNFGCASAVYTIEALWSGHLGWWVWSTVGLLSTAWFVCVAYDWRQAYRVKRSIRRSSGSAFSPV